MKKQDLVIATFAALAWAAPSLSCAETTYWRHDFVGHFYGDSVIPLVQGFFVEATDLQTGSGTLYDVAVDIGTTHFTMANSGGGAYSDTGGVARAGGVLGGELADDEYTLSTETNDFAIVLFKSNPQDSYFFYTVKGWAGLGTAGANFPGAGDLTYTTSQIFPSAVPEPASWAMMLGGLAALLYRYSRRVTVRESTPSVSC